MYFEKASAFLSVSGQNLSAADITGIWLSSDDDTVITEVKELAPHFFPNVEDNIAWVPVRNPPDVMEYGKMLKVAKDRMVRRREVPVTAL